MKLRVQHEHGAIETLTLVPPIEAKLGLKLNSLADASGLEHWFTADGFYDGWSSHAPEGITDGEADRLIERVEESREIESDQR